MKASKLGRGLTSIDIGGGRFTSLGHQIGRRHVFWFGPQNRTHVQRSRITEVEGM